MGVLSIMYRDPDRAPYLYTLRSCAAMHGLTLELVKASFTAPFAEALVDGSVDILAENYWGLQQVRAAGAPLVSIATAVTTLNETLFVRPEIESLDDLHGRRFAVRGQGPSQLIPSLWLRDHGLADVETVIVRDEDAGRWGVWKTVAAGECHGCFVTNFYQDAPRAAGLKELPIAPFGFLGNVTLTTTEATLDARRSDLQRLVKAAFVASRLFKSDDAAILDIMRQEPGALMGIAGEDDLRRIHAILRDELADVPVPTAEAISNTHRMCLDRSPELRTFNPLMMWDLSLAREAERAAARP